MAIWVTFLIYAALFVLSDLLLPKPDVENAKPAGLGDFGFPTADEERVVPLIWGTVRVRGPNVVWWGDLRQEAITTEQKVGMFRSIDVITGYRYKVGIQQALCRGPDVQLRNVIIKKKVVYGIDRTPSDPVITHDQTFTIDEPELFGGDDLGTGGIIGTLRFFAGQNPQTASTYLSGFQQTVAGNTPGYIGTCYIAPDVDPVYIGNSATRVEPWEFDLRRIPDPLSLPAGQEVIEQGANPISVLYEIMTNTDWGLGIDPNTIDTRDPTLFPSSLRKVAETLSAEDNGFSFLLDRPEEASNLVRRIEEQIDGVLFFNNVSGLWQVNIARDDYTLGSIPELDSTNIVEIKRFTRSSYEGTVNQVRMPFAQRDDNYKKTSALAQDMANVRIQDGVNVSTNIRHPGVVSAVTANDLVWRELTQLAFPLANAEIVVDRSFHDAQPLSVYKLTDADLNVAELPMRVKQIDFGELEDGRITLELVQDVFKAAAGAFSDPPGSGWDPPADDLAAFPSDEQVAIEAPRAFTFRATTAGVDDSEVHAWGRRQDPEAVAVRIVERHSSGTPSGAFADGGDFYGGFALLAELDSALSAGSAFPLTALLLTASDDSQEDLLAALPSTAGDLGELGRDLLTLLYVDGEWMLPRSAQASGGDVQLNDVYRGVLDSAMVDHSAGTKVWLVFVGAGISNAGFVPTHNVDVKLLPRSRSDIVAEGDATEIAIAPLANRTRRPYPPSELDLNGTRFDTSTSLEGSGSGEDVGIGLEFARRDFRIAEGGDEIASLGVDAASLFSDFPAANSTTHDVIVVDDPDGSPTTLFTQDFAALNTGTLRRLDILEQTGGVIPTRMRVQLRAKHDYESVNYSAREDLIWDFDVTTELTGSFNYGVLDTSDVSNSFTVADGSTDHDFTLSTAFTTGDVEYRINGGSWTTLISASSTTGSIPNASISTSDTVEIRHGSTDTGAQKLIVMDVGASTFVAHGVLIT